MRRLRNVSEELRSVLVVTLVVAACADGGGPEPEAVVVAERDSAGVSIIENHFDTAAVRAGWQLGTEPLLTIGGQDVPESSQLYQVSGAVRLSDGRIAVADAGSAEVRIFAADGAPLARYGRKGEGPGEFMEPALAGRAAGDTLVVFDAGLRRATILTADSGHVRSYQVGLEGGGYPIARGLLRDGSLAIGGGMYFSSSEGFPNGAIRAPSKYLVVAPDGTVGADLGEFPAAEMYAKSDGSSFRAMGIPFGRVTAFGPTSDHLWLGTGDTWELRAYTQAGSLARIVRLERPPVAVTAAMRDAVIEESVADAPSENEARSQRALLQEIPMPAHLPPYELLRADALDHVWIGEYLPPGAHARDWTIIDTRGKVVGRITTPELTLPLDIGADYLLGLTSDELGVEQLTLWRLERPGSR